MVNFRPHSREDITLRVCWLNNQSATLYALDDPSHITTVEEQKKWFDDYEKKLEKGEKRFFSIIVNDHPVGFMGLSNIDKINKTAEIFILIGNDKYRGRGVGKESIIYLMNYASKEIGLESLSLKVNKLNQPAIGLYQKLGFQKTNEDDSEIKMSFCL